jgi:hypothetical protein
MLYKPKSTEEDEEAWKACLAASGNHIPDELLMPVQLIPAI